MKKKYLALGSVAAVVCAVAVCVRGVNKSIDILDDVRL